MNAYPEYKDSGISWLGNVPAHWEFKRSKSVFRTLDIRSAEGKEELLSVSEKNGVALRKNTNVTMFQAASYTGYKLCWPNDLVINSLWAWMTGLGFSKYHGIISTAYSVFRIWNQGKFDSNYGNYLLRSKAYNWEFRVRSKGIWRSRYLLSDDSFLSMPLLIPPFYEQQQISRYLDWQSSKINKFIKAKKKLIALLKEQKQNIINEAVTKGINPDVEMKDSGVEWLGGIPAHWEIVSIKRIAKSIQTGPFGSQLHAHDYIDNGIPLINPKHLKDGTIVPDSSCTIDNENQQRLIKYCLQTSDLIMARRGELGRCAIVTEKENGWLCGTGSLFLRLRQGYFVEKYLYLVMSSKGIAKVLSLGSIGATMDNLNGTIIGNLKLPIIPLTEQQEIINYLEKETALIDKTIARTEREIELIQEFRTRLVSDVVTGKVDVRSVEIPDFEPVEADLEVQDDEESEDDLITEGIEE